MMADNSGSEYDFAPKKEPSPVEKAGKQRDLKPDRSPEKVCPHCGFRYRGRLRQGKCPECAGQIDGIQTDLLQFSEPRWLSRAGTGWVVAAIGFAVLLAGMGITWKEHVLEGAVLEVVAAWITAFGVMKGTMPEPKRAIGMVAKSIRGCAWATAFLWTIVLMLFVAKAPAKAQTVCVVLILLMYGLETVLLAIETRLMAMRIPNDSLAAQALNLGWLMPAMCIVVAILNLIAAATSPQVTTFCALPLIGAFGLWGIIVLGQLGMQMRDASDAAIAIEVRKAEAGMKKS